MARFNADLDNGVIQAMEALGKKAPEVMEAMVEAGGEVAYRNVRANMRSSFKTTRSLEKGLRKTRVFKTPSDDGIAVKIGFSGYSDHKSGKFGNGVPVPLIATAREKGTKHGEARKPFFKKSFNKSEITAAMQAVEPKLFEGAPQ